MITTKGTAWQTHLDYFMIRFGTDAVEKVKTQIRPENRALLFDKPIVAISRVSLDAVMDFLVTADRVLGKGDKSLIQDCLREKARQEIRGIYKIFVAILSPEAILKRAANFWRHIYQQGKVEAIRKDAHTIEMNVTEFDGMPPEHDFTVVVYIEEMLNMCNCKNPRGRIVKSYSRGDDQCLFEFTWQ